MNDNDSGTEYDDSQIQGDDEAGFEDNSEHEERDADVQLGKKMRGKEISRLPCRHGKRKSVGCRIASAIGL